MTRKGWWKKLYLVIYIKIIYILCGHFGGNFQKWSLAFCYSVNPALIEYLPYAWKCLKIVNQKYRNKTSAHPGEAHRAYGKNCWGKNEKKVVLKNVQKSIRKCNVLTANQGNWTLKWRLDSWGRGAFSCKEQFLPFNQYIIFTHSAPWYAP